MSWSKDIPLKWDIIHIPTYPDGAIIDVKFECGKCGRKLLAEGVEIPSPFYGGNSESESRRWGDRVPVECDCGAEYEVGADNTIVGWGINFEGEKLPKTFRYKEYRVSGEPEEDT